MKDLIAISNCPHWLRLPPALVADIVAEAEKDGECQAKRCEGCDAEAREPGWVHRLKAATRNAAQKMISSSGMIAPIMEPRRIKAGEAGRVGTDDHPEAVLLARDGMV
jgi:hypothetical protein